MCLTKIMLHVLLGFFQQSTVSRQITVIYFGQSWRSVLVIEVSAPLELVICTGTVGRHACQQRWLGWKLSHLERMWGRLRAVVASFRGASVCLEVASLGRGSVGHQLVSSVLLSSDSKS